MTVRRLTRAELEHIIGVERLYLSDLLLMEPDSEMAQEAEFVEYLILKLEVMREESAG